MARKTPEPWHPNWAYTGGAELNFLLAEAKEALQGTIELGISSDQRSAALAGVFGAGAFGLFTVSATIFVGPNQSGTFLFGAMLVGTLLLVASVCCTIAAFPGDFFVSGYEPKLLFPSATDESWMKRYAIEDIQMRIQSNRHEIAREANLIKGAIGCAAASLICTFIFVSAGVFQIRYSPKLSHPSSAAGSAQAGEVVEMTLCLPASWTEKCYGSQCKLLIGGKYTMPAPQQQH